jgi:hypothetical protein
VPADVPQHAADDAERMRVVLQEACNMAVPIALMSRDLLAGLQGVFASLQDDTLTLKFPAVPTESAFRPPAFCVASFAYGARPHLFTTRVRHVALAHDGALMMVERPRAIPCVESRIAVRLAIDPNAPLVVRVGSAAGPMDARALDLSLCGVRVELDGSRVLQAGERVEVELVLGEDRMRLRGIVRRVDPPQFGIYFPDAITEGQLTPPAVLRRIVARAAG